MKKSYFLRIGPAWLIAGLLYLSPGLAYGQSTAPMAKPIDIEGKVAAIKEVFSPKAREEFTRELYLSIQQQPRTNLDHISPGAVDAITTLLTDRNYMVRAWAASALAEIGAPALRAVPTLYAVGRSMLPRAAGPSNSPAYALTFAAAEIERAAGME